MTHLFKPYGELLHHGLLKNVQDNGIGLGLSNSKIFTDALNGEIKFLKHERGNTQLFLSIPVLQDNSSNRAKIGSSKRVNVSKRDQNLFPDRLKNSFCSLNISLKESKSARAQRSSGRISIFNRNSSNDSSLNPVRIF